MINLCKLVLLLALSSIGYASACSCAPWGSATQMLKDYDAVFVAIPSSSSRIDTTVSVPDYMRNLIQRTSFTVVRNFKGADLETLELYSVKDVGTNCGVGFKQDEGVFLVFAYLNEGLLYTSSCSVDVVDYETPEVTAMIKALSKL